MPAEVYRTPEQRFDALEGYAFAPSYVDLDGDLDGLRMHYVDEGRGSPVLLLHGEPTWAYLYRKMIPALAQSQRCIAPDFVGFGRSDKVTDASWYSYDLHVESIAQLVERLDLRDVTVVVQDWGGPIGLRVAVESEARFARLVILNTGLFRPGRGHPSAGFLAWLDFVKRNPDLPIGFVIQSATATQLSETVLAGYEAPFPDQASKAGAVAFPLMVPLEEDDPGAKEMAAAYEELSRWAKPALVAFSDSDPVFSLGAGRRLAEHIPGAVPFVAIEGASHFLQEDRGEAIAAEIVGFLAST